MANSYGLLRLPKIPEIKGRRVAGFVADMTVASPLRCVHAKHLNPTLASSLFFFKVKTESVPYLDKTRERARQKRLAVMKEAAEAAAKLQAAPAEPPKQLSGAQKKAAAALAEAQKTNPRWTEDGPRKRKGRQEQIMEEWDDLAKEERLYKKLRKGQITQKQFDAAMKNQEGSDIESESGAQDSD